MVLNKIPNIHVIKLMQSLKSREYVTETFNWQIYYWTLTDKGVTYLREYLHLGEQVVPATHKAAQHEMDRMQERRNFRERREGGFRRDGFKKDSDDFRPRYVCSMFSFVSYSIFSCFATLNPSLNYINNQRLHLRSSHSNLNTNQYDRLL